jgi:LysM repeat protein
MANSSPQFHTVLRGENLTTIARKYGFTNYKTIAVYNGLKNENSLKEGQRIVIPRSRQGYDVLIGKLNQLKSEMAEMTKGVANQLNVDKQEMDRKNKAIDVTFDALMLTRTITKVGFKTIIASKDALTRMPAIKNAMVEVAELVADQAVDSFDKKYVKEENQEVIPTAYKVYKHKYKVAFKVAKNTLKVLDLAEVALDFIKPTTIAKYISAYTAGESIEETEANAKKMIEKTHQQAIMNLNEKITRLTNERNMLYSNQQMSIPVMVH